jgi:hypothetical protein
MAVTTIETVIANPRRQPNEGISQGFYDGAGRFHPIRAADDYDPEAVGEHHQYAPKKRAKKKHRKNPKGRKMAQRRLSAKQIKAGFGGKRRQSAIKRKRKSSAASHRPKANRPHWLSKTAAGRPSQRKRKKNVAMGYRGSAGWRAGKKKTSSARPHKVARKRNLGTIFALTANPAKGHKSMAKTHTKKRRATSNRSAGSRRPKEMNRTRRRRNPGQFGGPSDWLQGGAGVLTGVVATRGLPQLILGASNKGPMGYAANAVATAITTFAAHMAFPRHRVFTASVLAGGAAAIISRVIGDYSLLGSYSSQLGLGDYLMNFNFTTPQYLAPGNPRGLIAQGAAPAAAIPVNMNSAASAGVSGWGQNLY